MNIKTSSGLHFLICVMYIDGFVVEEVVAFNNAIALFPFAFSILEVGQPTLDNWFSKRLGSRLTKKGRELG